MRLICRCFICSSSFVDWLDYRAIKVQRGASNGHVTDPECFLREIVVLGYDNVNCTFQAFFCSYLKPFSQMEECL